MGKIREEEHDCDFPMETKEIIIDLVRCDKCGYFKEVFSYDKEWKVLGDD